MNELVAVGGENELAMIEAIGKRFMVAQQISEVMHTASILPDHLRTRKVAGKVIDLSKEEIRANCVLIVNQALRWGVDPFAILSSTFVIGGNLGFDGKLIATIVNKLGGLSEKLSYSFSGEGQNLTVTVSGKLQGEDTPREVKVCVKDAKTDNQIWVKDPEQKLCYTGATRWARRHCPHVLLGIISDDEPVGEIVEAESFGPAEVKESEAADAVYEQWRDRIDGEDEQSELGRMVDRINAELILTPAMRSALVGMARRRYKQLQPVETVAAE